MPTTDRGAAAFHFPATVRLRFHSRHLRPKSERPGRLTVLDTTGPVTQTNAEGWAQLMTSGDIGGFAIFTYTPDGMRPACRSKPATPLLSAGFRRHGRCLHRSRHRQSRFRRGQCQCRNPRQHGRPNRQRIDPSSRPGSHLFYVDGFHLRVPGHRQRARHGRVRYALGRTDRRHGAARQRHPQ